MPRKRTIDKIKKILTLINRWKVIMAILLIGIGLFYWYEYRPSRSYIECNQEALEWMRENAEDLSDNLGLSIDIYNFRYIKCLREKGINK